MGMEEKEPQKVDKQMPDEDKKEGVVVNLPLPYHAVGGSLVKRSRGRPKKLVPRPTFDDLEYHAEVIKRKEAYLQEDPLVRVAEDRMSTIEVLQRIKVELAKESASLLFSRQEHDKYGKDTSQMSTRRIAALREIASLEMEIRDLGAAVIDLKSEQFQKIFKYLLECIGEVAVETFPLEKVDIFLNRLQTKLNGWEEIAQNLVR
jgi:hypothetical protein